MAAARTDRSSPTPLTPAAAAKKQAKQQRIRSLRTARTCSTAQAAEALGVSQKTIQRWENEGIIICARTRANHRRVPLSEIERLRRERHPS